jgi:hypothetical protein
VLFDQAGTPLAEQLIDDVDEPGSLAAADHVRMDDTEQREGGRAAPTTRRAAGRA